MNQRYGSKESDVTGAGYEFVSNSRQTGGSLDQYVDKKHKREKKYLDFVLNPDIEMPIRMPSDFTYPTNLMSYKQNFQISIGAMGDFCGYYAPQNHFLFTPNNNSSTATQNKSCSYMFFTRSVTGTDYFSTSYNTQSLAATTGYSQKVVDPNPSFPYHLNFDSARVIGGMMKVQYIGSLQNTSGMISVAADLIAQNSFPTGDQLPPTNSQMYNLLVYKKFSASEQTQSVWFPVDPSVQNFINVDRAQNATTTSFPDVSQLVFYIYGYGLPASTMLDITIETYYEAVPNYQSSSLFVASQAVSKEDTKSAWNEIMNVGKQNLGQILITGAKTAANWVSGGLAGLGAKAVSWLAS